MLGLKGKPLCPIDAIRREVAVVQLSILWHCCDGKRHAIVLECATELPHRVRDCIEDPGRVGGTGLGCCVMRYSHEDENVQ